MHKPTWIDRGSERVHDGRKTPFERRGLKTRSENTDDRRYQTHYRTAMDEWGRKEKKAFRGDSNERNDR